LVTALCFGAMASADFNTGFEAPAYNGSAGGTLLAGQQAWYNPVAGSAEYKVYTYAGNTYGVVQNPYGGDQFVGGRMEGNAAFARAQHDFAWGDEDLWRVTYDVAGLYTGTLPAVNNLGSFSLQPSTSARYFQSIFQWVDPNNPVAWNAGYYSLEYPTTGNPYLPGPAWQNLLTNHWYRQSTLFRMSDQQILQVSIQDLVTGEMSVVNNPGLHFLNPAGGIPTGFRFFTGGGAGASPPGNYLAWDNLAIPEPASALLAALGALLLRRR
jgi:hypothetical protein